MSVNLQVYTPISFQKVLNKAKKKNTLSQSLREFFKPTRHAVFYFLFYFIFLTSIGRCLHAHPKPKMTEKFQLPYFQKSNGILHIFLSSHVLKFFQNSKLSSFFVVKMKKKKLFQEKKNESLNFAKSNAHRKTNALRHRIFFFFFLA